MSKELGPIGRSGTFLWQLDSPSGSGMNLWSGKLDANNGYSAEYAKKAAILFEAAPALLEALQDACETLAMLTDPERIKQSRVQIAWAQAVACEARARAAIALATGEPQC